MELLRSLGFRVEVLPSGYDEPPIPGLSPAALAQAHAAAKLQAALALLPEAPDVPVLAADTVVDRDGVALGKPRDAAEAAAMLASLAGREHLVHSAFALAAPGSAERVSELETTRVWFHALEPEEIAEYVASGEPLDKAGAYGIQGRAAALVARIEGDFYTVMGLPLSRFIRTMRRLGFTLPETK